MTITPKSGTAGASTTVKVKNNAEGTVEGIDANDTVTVSSGATVNIEGTGGTVDLTAGGSQGKIKNTAAAGGDNITIKTSGDEFTLGPGQEINF